MRSVGLADKRKGNSGRAAIKELSTEEN